MQLHLCDYKGAPTPSRGTSQGAGALAAAHMGAARAHLYDAAPAPSRGAPQVGSGSSPKWRSTSRVMHSTSGCSGRQSAISRIFCIVLMTAPAGRVGSWGGLVRRAESHQQAAKAVLKRACEEGQKSNISRMICIVLSMAPPGWQLGGMVGQECYQVHLLQGALHGACRRGRREGIFIEGGMRGGCAHSEQHPRPASASAAST